MQENILFCKEHKRYKADYALRNISNLIVVSESYVTKHLPGKLEIYLPTIEDLEAQLSGGY